MDSEDVVAKLITELKDLRIRVAQLEAVAAPNQGQAERSDSTAAASQLRPGDRVQIKNKVRKPATWSSSAEWNQEKAQKATVTHHYKEQVHFETDNGVKT